MAHSVREFQFAETMQQELLALASEVKKGIDNPGPDLEIMKKFFDDMEKWKKKNPWKYTMVCLFLSTEFEGENPDEVMESLAQRHDLVLGNPQCFRNPNFAQDRDKPYPLPKRVHEALTNTAHMFLVQIEDLVTAFLTQPSTSPQPLAKVAKKKKKASKKKA